MFGIGMPELVVIFVIALLVFGPKELPGIARTIGRAMSELRKASDDLRDGIQREIDSVERETAIETPGGALDEASAMGADGTQADAVPADDPVVPEYDSSRSQVDRSMAEPESVMAETPDETAGSTTEPAQAAADLPPASEPSAPTGTEDTPPDPRAPETTHA